MNWRLTEDRHRGLSLRVMGTEAIGAVLDNGQLIA